MITRCWRLGKASPLGASPSSAGCNGSSAGINTEFCGPLSQQAAAVRFDLLLHGRSLNLTSYFRECLSCETLLPTAA